MNIGNFGLLPGSLANVFSFTGSERRLRIWVAFHFYSLLECWPRRRWWDIVIAADTVKADIYPGFAGRESVSSNEPRHPGTILNRLLYDGR